ncbi:MAG: hypothetical protein IAI49_05055 [Candidatus Eremiobacteraeota bacterium]|nr:hypothetical protein [Candidatus Eremiobacteraeota bacterium]
MIVQHLAEDGEHTCTPSERKSVRRYQIEMAGAALAYFVTLFVSVRYVDHLPLGALKTLVALLPMIGVVAMVLAFVRFTLRCDEMQRQTILVSGAISAIVTAVVTMCFGFLENAGVPAVPMTFVWPIVGLVFGVSFPLVRRRYR